MKADCTSPIRQMKNNIQCKTPIEDLEKNALEHYEKLSSKSHEWMNVIPRAIKLYYKLRKLREGKYG